MLKFRIGLLLSALSLCACDHHKKVDQAQAEAGSAAVGPSDSVFTGEPPPATPATTSPATATGPNTSAPAANSPAPSASVPVATRPTRGETPPTPPDAIANAPAETASASNTPAPETNSSPSTPETAMPDAAASSTAPVTAATTPGAMPPASSSDNGPVSDRLTINTPSPVASPAPAAVAEEEVVVIDTPQGRIVIETDDSAAPKTSANFRKLAADGFYNHTIFHRVIPHFVIQGGDPNSLSGDRTIQGRGGPNYTLPPEIKLKHTRGAVAMARLPDSVNPGRDSNGSQFYICVVDSPSLDNQYTVFGHVIKGMDVVDAISNLARDKNDNPLNRVEMEVTLEPKDQALSESSAASP